MTTWHPGGGGAMGFMGGMANAVPVVSRPSSANVNRDFDMKGSFPYEINTLLRNRHYAYPD
jgi:hypothetical protein